MNFALVKNGIIVNSVTCDSIESAINLYDVHYQVVSMDGLSAGIGWSYDGDIFTPPVLVTSPQEMAAKNMIAARSEYDCATHTINQLNERIEDDDYSVITKEIVNEMLVKWTGYRKQLRAYIKTSDGSRLLPTAPVS
ncbi:hypothetical protein [Escherichia coli]|uniref:hypothetical protein n=1 Tax=Escherichia coli TaxID=562 RepID=UPI001C40829E|nr:hypothetical protein [Escherichia coli]